jgi:hypothetical protein
MKYPGMPHHQESLFYDPDMALDHTAFPQPRSAPPNPAGGSRTQSQPSPGSVQAIPPTQATQPDVSGAFHAQDIQQRQVQPQPVPTQAMKGQQLPSQSTAAVWSQIQSLVQSLNPNSSQP